MYSLRASPRLKDATLSSTECEDLYIDLLLSVRKMYRICKLVHADLSEYNILYHENRLWIIDVSQSVEHDHPHAFDFLRKDLKNVEDFFSRFGVKCMGLRKAFEFVTREGLEVNDEEVLRSWLAEAEKQATESQDGTGQQNNKELTEASHEDSVFLQSYIPRTLNEVYDPERDITKLRKGERGDLIYADTVGLLSQEAGPSDTVHSSTRSSSKPEHPQHPQPDEGSEGTTHSESGSESSSDASDDDGDGDAFQERKPRGHRHEDREAKKVKHSHPSLDVPLMTSICLGEKTCSQSGSKRTSEEKDAQSREKETHEADKKVTSGRVVRDI
jgi:RIO kinase 1